MRFRELNQLFDPGYRPAYGAFFNELGAITRFADPERLAGLLWEYLSNGIGIAPNELIIRASSADDDLLRIAKRFFHSLELDSRPVGYYRHSIGEPGFCGRNFNIALKNRNSGDFQDIGNFLAFDRDGVGAFYEVALGDTVIQRALRGHDHVLHSYAVVAPALLNQIEGLNFINSITVATVLYREGLRASNRSNQERILSKYLRYMFMLHDHKGIGFDDIKKSVVSFEKLYFGNQSGVDQQIITDLEFKAPVFRKALRRAEISNAEQIE